MVLGLTLRQCVVKLVAILCREMLATMMASAKIQESDVSVDRYVLLWESVIV